MSPGRDFNSNEENYDAGVCYNWVTQNAAVL